MNNELKIGHIKQGLLILQAAYPNMRPSTEETSLIWFDAFKGCDPEKFLAAIRTQIITNKTIPTIADIHETISEGESDWTTAWSKTMSAVRIFGYANELGAKDYLASIWQTVSVIGWKEICLCQTSDLQILRAQFRQIFKPQHDRKIFDKKLTLTKNSSLSLNINKLAELKQLK